MRLIDADELVETYEKETGYTWGAKGILECPKMFIDNAPTAEVGYFSNCASCERVVKIRVNRPQGEWVKDEEHSITINMFRCSNCNGGGHTHFKYCPNCGAEMGVKKNETY